MAFETDERMARLEGCMENFLKSQMDKGKEKASNEGTSSNHGTRVDLYTLLHRQAHMTMAEQQQFTSKFNSQKLNFWSFMERPSYLD